MVTEGAFGHLKVQWKALSRNCEGLLEAVNAVTLACVVLHHLCIERREVTLLSRHMSLDPKQNERRPIRLVRDMLLMTNRPNIPDSCKQAAMIRDTLK